MQVLPSKELLSEVLDKGKGSITKIEYNPSKTIVEYEQLERYWNSINTYELAHKNLKQWAKLKNVFDIIDWSEEPEQIFKKAEELRNEINQRLRCGKW